MYSRYRSCFSPEWVIRETKTEAITLCKPHLTSPAAFPPLSGTHWTAECPSSLQGQPPWSSSQTAQGRTLSVCCVLVSGCVPFWRSWLPPADALEDSLGAAAALLCPGAELCFQATFLGFRPPSTTPGQWRGQWGLCGTRRSTLTPSPGPGWVPGPSWRRAHGYSSPLWKPTTASAAAPSRCLSPKHPLFLGAELNVASDVSSPAPCVSEALLSPHSCLCRVGPPSFTDPSPSYTHTHMHTCTSMETGLLSVPW